jgi:nucleoside-diphosphate-sugar epimerase
VSSVGVHGWPGVDGIDESFPVAVRPGRRDYHGTKAAAEELVRSWPGGPEAVIVRPTITYGPGDRDGMLTRLIGLVASGRFVRIGRGTNHFHLTHIDDLVRGLLLAGTHPAAPGETFILAGPRSIAVREMVVLIERSLDLPPRRISLPEPLARPAAWAIEAAWRAATAVGLPLPRQGPPVTPTKINVLCAHRGFSSAKAARLLGYAPQVDYPKGLDRTLAWMSEPSTVHPFGIKLPSSADLLV